MDDNRYEGMSPGDIDFIENAKDPSEISRRWGFPGEDLLPWGQQRVWPWLDLPWTYDQVALGELLKDDALEVSIDESGDVRLDYWL